MDRGGAQARRDQGGQEPVLAARYRHGGRDGAARRRRGLLHLRGRARQHQGQPRAGEFLRRQAQEHDAGFPDRSQQDRAERRLSHPLHGADEARAPQIRERRADLRERAQGRRRRLDGVPGAAMARAGRRPLYRHRLLSHHARPRQRLDQLRHLSGDDPRRQVRRLLYLARQARPPDTRQVQGARPVDAGRSRLRRRSHDLPHGLQRSALRGERVRDRRRYARQAGGGDQGPGHRPADPGQCRDRARGFRRAGL